MFEYSTHFTVFSTYFLRHVSAPMSVISLPGSGSGTWLVDVTAHNSSRGHEVGRRSSHKVHMVTSCDLVILVWRHSSLLFIALAPRDAILVASAICRVSALV